MFINCKKFPVLMVKWCNGRHGCFKSTCESNNGSSPFLTTKKMFFEIMVGWCNGRHGRL